MATREELYEKLEDAAFALLMYDVAEAEGEKLIAENERLKADDTFRVPSDIDKRCRETIKRAFRRKRRKAFLHKIFSWIEVG